MWVDGATSERPHSARSGCEKGMNYRDIDQLFLDEEFVLQADEIILQFGEVGDLCS